MAEEVSQIASQHQNADDFEYEAESQSLDDELTYEDLVEFIQRNPSYESLIMHALELVPMYPARSVLAQELIPFKKKNCLQTPQQILTLMVKYGALDETLLVDGEPYEGTFEVFQEDETIPEEADIAYELTLTEFGKRARQEFGPAAKIVKLFEDDAESAPIYSKVLAFVNIEGGRPKAEIEELLLADDDAVKRNPKTNVPTIYPVYYTTALEDAGALYWDGVWNLTEAGKAFLA